MHALNNDDGEVEAKEAPKDPREELLTISWADQVPIGEGAPRALSWLHLRCVARAGLNGELEGLRPHPRPLPRGTRPVIVLRQLPAAPVCCVGDLAEQELRTLEPVVDEPASELEPAPVEAAPVPEEPPAAPAPAAVPEASTLAQAPLPEAVLAVGAEPVRRRSWAALLLALPLVLPLLADHPAPPRLPPAQPEITVVAPSAPAQARELEPVPAPAAPAAKHMRRLRWRGLGG